MAKIAKRQFKLVSKYKPLGDQPGAISSLKKGISEDKRFQTLLGVTGSGKTFSMANIIDGTTSPVLVMAPNKALAAQLYREYKNYFPDNSVNYFVSYYDYYQPEAYLPITDTYIGKEAMINQEIDRFRHQATSALLSRNDVIVVASVSCIYNLGVPINYLQSSLRLSKGQTITRSDLISQLIKIQFSRTNGVLERGNFRARGEVIEIMPSSNKSYYRLELKDQKIDNLYVIDGVTYKIKEELPEIVIFPAKHFISTKPQIEAAISDIKAELKDRLKYFKDNKLLLEAQRLERRSRYDMEMLKTLGYCHGIENYSRHLSGKLAGEAPDSLLAYFPKDKEGKPDFLTIIDESHIAVPQIRGMYEGDRSRKETLVKYGWRLPSALDNRPLRFQEFLERVNKIIFTTATPGKWELEKSKNIAKQIIRPTGLVDPPITVRPVFDKKNNWTQIDDIVSIVKEKINPKERVIINTLTKRQAEDLVEYLEKTNIKSEYLHSDVKLVERTEVLKAFREGKFNVLVGVNLLREGLDLPEVVLVAILDADREGFLRSRTSLMQTMGRAARNVLGRVILYADNITDSIRYAIQEVEARRKKQLEYNKKQGITPKTIEKDIEDLLDFDSFTKGEDSKKTSKSKKTKSSKNNLKKPRNKFK
ncbi:MAG: excinuclease ABC subunit UvrB [Candidatus Pacebacteria bacterium]|nr:excinuclease ABC subunit UvrB [Candidatus Paceibacterota bacterium]